MLPNDGWHASNPVERFKRLAAELARRRALPLSERFPTFKDRPPQRPIDRVSSLDGWESIGVLPPPPFLYQNLTPQITPIALPAGVWTEILQPSPVRVGVVFYNHLVQTITFRIRGDDNATGFELFDPTNTRPIIWDWYNFWSLLPHGWQAFNQFAASCTLTVYSFNLSPQLVIAS
jgi:hypothetical protein